MATAAVTTVVVTTIAAMVSVLIIRFFKKLLPAEVARPCAPCLGAIRVPVVADPWKILSAAEPVVNALGQTSHALGQYLDVDTGFTFGSDACPRPARRLLRVINTPIEWLLLGDGREASGFFLVTGLGSYHLIEDLHATR